MMQKTILNQEIYIKIHDTDISLDETPRKETRQEDSSLVYIFIPKHFNRYQFEELKRSISIIKKYDDRFIKQAYGIIYYSNFEEDERVCYVDDKIYYFLGDENTPGIAKGFIKEVPILPEEEIIIPSLAYSFLSSEYTSGIVIDSTIKVPILPEKDSIIPTVDER